VIVAAVGCCDNLDYLNELLPKPIIEFLKANYLQAKIIQDKQFFNKIRNYAENPSYIQLHSLLTIINKLAHREMFEVAVNYAYIYQYNSYNSRLDNKPAFTYRYCIDCAFFHYVNRPNFHFRIKYDIVQTFFPTESRKYKIIKDLICANCYNLLFDNTVIINPQRWISIGPPPRHSIQNHY